MQPQKHNGRRFTIEYKVFTLFLYKQSDKAYRVLASTRKSILDVLKINSI